jgi:hypothetical protein
VERWTTTYVHIGEKAISNHKLMGHDYLCVKSSGYNHIALAIEEENRPEQDENASCRPVQILFAT